MHYEVRPSWGTAPPCDHVPSLDGIGVKEPQFGPSKRSKSDKGGMAPIGRGKKLGTSTWSMRIWSAHAAPWPVGPHPLQVNSAQPPNQTQWLIPDIRSNQLMHYKCWCPHETSSISNYVDTELERPRIM